MPKRLSRERKRQLHTAKSEIWLTYGFSLLLWPAFNAGNVINAVRIRSVRFLVASFLFYGAGWGVDKLILPESPFGVGRPFSAMLSAGLAASYTNEERRKLKLTQEQAAAELKAAQQSDAPEKND